MTSITEDAIKFSRDKWSHINIYVCVPNCYGSYITPMSLPFLWYFNNVNLKFADTNIIHIETSTKMYTPF